jgi:hypothetical protein
MKIQSTNHSVPLLSKFTFTTMKSFLTYINCGIHRSVYLFLVSFCWLYCGYWLAIVFAAFVRSRLPPFCNTYCVVHNYILTSSIFWFRCKILCSKHFQMKTYCVPQTSSSNKTIHLDMTFDINGSVGNIAEKTFSPSRGHKYSTDITRIAISALFLLECEKVSGCCV